MYEDGEQPTLSAYDSFGQLLPDGEYRYQFRSIPVGGASTTRQRDVLKGKGTSGSKGKPPVVNILSGKFEVQGGQLVYR
jgi:hypothetical protein